MKWTGWMGSWDYSFARCGRDEGVRGSGGKRDFVIVELPRDAAVQAVFGMPIYLLLE